MSLTDSLLRTADLLDRHGPLAWQRVYDWTVTGRMPSTGVRGGGTGTGASDATLEERAGDRAAAAYHDELNTRAVRLFTDCRHLVAAPVAPRTISPGLLAQACRQAAPHAHNAPHPKRTHTDSERVATIVAICCPVRPKHLNNRDLLAAQIATDGWCISCWRNDGMLEPIDHRPGGGPFFRDLCRWCGYFKNHHGVLPPLNVLRIRHAGRSVTEAAVAAALGRSA